MRVLVTGHKGYIGTVLVPMLQEHGHDVVGLDSDLYRGSTFGTLDMNIPEILKDVREVEAADVNGFDAILHLAGLSNDPLGDLDPNLTHDINHKASVRLATLAKEQGVARFIFSSSCSNYGASGSDDWLVEESSLNPVTPYGQTKVLVEQDVSKLADDTFSPTFLRNATAYGVSSRLRFDLVLNNLVAWAFTTGTVLLKSDGTAWRPIVHIEDISRAFIATLHAPRETIHNEVFNVGRNEDNYRIRDIAQIACDAVPNSRVEFAAQSDDPDKRQFNVGKDPRNYRVDSSKILRVLPEFQPQWDAKRGAQQLYEAFTANNVTREDFEGPRYQRVAHIRHLLSEGKLDNTLRWTS